MGNNNSSKSRMQMIFKETSSEEECKTALISLKYLEIFFEKYDYDSSSIKFSEARAILENMEKISKNKLEQFDLIEKKRINFEKDMTRKPIYHTKKQNQLLMIMNNEYKDLPELEDVKKDPIKNPEFEELKRDIKCVIKCVMLHAKANYKQAVDALIKSNGDVVDAIIDLTN